MKSCEIHKTLFIGDKRTIILVQAIKELLTSKRIAPSGKGDKNTSGSKFQFLCNSICNVSRPNFGSRLTICGLLLLTLR